MIAAVLKGKRRIVVEKRKKPRPKLEEVLIRVKAASICGTDLHFYEGRLSSAKPIVLGHDFSGVVEEIGGGVQTLSPGDRVTAEIVRYCGKCFYCSSGDYHLCLNNTFMGFEIDGAFEEYVVVPEKNVFKLPRELSFEEAAILEPVTTCLHAMDFIEPKEGETVAVVGQGPIGLVFDQIARLHGLRVIGLDLRDDRLRMARELGADFTFNAHDRKLKEKIKAITDDIGPDYAVEAVGSQETIDLASDLIRKGGELIVIGESEGLRGPPVSLADISIFTVYNGGSGKYPVAMDLVSKGKVNVRKLITHEVALADLPSVFGAISKGEMRAIKVVVKPQ